MNVFTPPHVNIYISQRRFPIDTNSAIALAQQVIIAEGVACNEVALHFVGKRKICQLHADYFNDPSFTDCITFPIDQEDVPGYRFLGEVFVCPEAALRYASEDDTDELYTEISLYAVHGLLHLLGYDDIDEKDRIIMREREQYHIKQLKEKSYLIKKKVN